MPLMWKNKIDGNLFWNAGSFKEAEIAEVIKEWTPAAATAAGFADYLPKVEATTASPTQKKTNNKKNNSKKSKK